MNVKQHSFTRGVLLVLLWSLFSAFTHASSPPAFKITNYTLV
jgi:hypothetical protein